MGLSLSRNIIESHGGRIWFENNSDDGATFLFDLPFADEK
jgi:two-component system sensor kinase FixL